MPTANLHERTGITIASATVKVTITFRFHCKNKLFNEVLFPILNDYIFILLSLSITF